MLTPNDLSAGYEPVPITFVDLLEASPGETAFVEDERDWSYDELRQAAHNVAARLITLGVKPTDRFKHQQASIRQCLLIGISGRRFCGNSTDSASSSPGFKMTTELKPHLLLPKKPLNFNQ